MELTKLYIRYDKVPWELGYPFLEEIDAIMPLISKEVHKAREKHKKNPEAEADFERLRHEDPRRGKKLGIGGG